MDKSKPERASKRVTVDIDPDAWPRFEALVKSAAKMGHKPHGGPKATKGNPAKKS